MKFKSTINEVDHRKYNALVYCEREDEKSFQFLVKISYKKRQRIYYGKPCRSVFCFRIKMNI